MLIELTRKSIWILADFRAELTLKSGQDGLILLGMREFVRREKANMQNLHELVAIVSN